MNIHKIIKLHSYILLIPFMLLVQSTSNVFGQTVDKTKLLDDISKFTENPDKNFVKSHNRIENLSKRDGENVREVYLFSLNDHKIERLTIEFISLNFPEGKDSFRFKESETYYFKNDKLIYCLESVSSNAKDKTDWEIRQG